MVIMSNSFSYARESSVRVQQDLALKQSQHQQRHAVVWTERLQQERVGGATLRQWRVFALCERYCGTVAKLSKNARSLRRRKRYFVHEMRDDPKTREKEHKFLLKFASHEIIEEN